MHTGTVDSVWSRITLPCRCDFKAGKREQKLLAYSTSQVQWPRIYSSVHELGSCGRIFRQSVTRMGCTGPDIWTKFLA